MEEDNFYVNIFSIFMEKVFKEVQDRLVGDVPTHNNMSRNMFGFYKNRNTNSKIYYNTF